MTKTTATEYEFAGDSSDGYFVYVVGKPDHVGGPYDTQDKATRRIRDLKRKVIVGEIDAAMINVGEIAPSKIVNGTPNVDKIAASSAYGKSKPFTIVRQVGCYPAISKHAYQR